ncbi:MAG: imidazoleglycerol-phosphate dehydratase HisB [Opitutales bacterium]
MREAKIKRDTKETQIELSINLDGSGVYDVKTPIPFFTHMLELFTRHGLFDLKVVSDGDVDVDYHHLVEDMGIVLGGAVKQALGTKAGINRYGFFTLPMDECLATVAIDLSNRAYLCYNVEADDSKRVRDFNLSLLKEFFQAFANEAGANLHIKLEYGTEPHHICEVIFKAFAKALDVATQKNPRLGDALPTTKGAL